jgi:ankyrin repeat protein
MYFVVRDSIIQDWPLGEFEDVLNEFVQKGGDINRIEENETLLMTAILANRSYMVSRILDVDGLDINVQVGDHTALTLAMSDSTVDRDIVKMILEREDLDVNKPTVFPPLSRAVESIYSYTVKIILDKPNIDIRMENTPPENRPFNVMKRTGNNDASIFTYLLNKGVEIDFRGDFEKKLLLNFLVNNSDNKQKINQILSRPDVDVNANFGGRKLLMMAIKTRNEKLLKTLLEHPKTDPNVILNQEGQVPLMYLEGFSIYQLNFDHKKVQLLLDNPKTEVDAVDSKGRTSIISYMMYFNEEDDASLKDSLFNIVKAGGDPTIPDNNGQTLEKYRTLGMEFLVEQIMELHSQNKK